MRRAELILYLVGVTASGALVFEAPRALRAPTALGAINVLLLLALLGLSIGGLIKLRAARRR